VDKETKNSQLFKLGGTAMSILEYLIHTSQETLQAKLQDKKTKKKTRKLLVLAFSETEWIKKRN